MAGENKRKNSVIKIILTDLAGVGCLVLFPFIAPIPGPGGIPLLLAAFGFFAVNHDWADDVIHYIKKHSENLQKIVFPNVTWIKWSWDILSVLILATGTVINIKSEHWFITGLSYGIMASSTTLFMLNRNRLTWLDKQLRRTGKR